MKDAVFFLSTVFKFSLEDLATIHTAHAENDKGTIIKYLTSVKEYTEELIEKVKK
jgi:hypothetical protein